MEKISEVKSDKAPKPVGPYSQAVKGGGFVFCSGQIGIEPVGGQLVTNSIAEETRQALDNLVAVLVASGATLKNVVRVDVFLTDMADFPELNKVYEGYFVDNPKPSRQTVAVLSLPKKARVEISCIAWVEQ